jgi:hypothetical protein
MKQITLNIETCGDCPYSLTIGRITCNKTGKRVTLDALHPNCPLPNKSDKLPLAISIMEQALAELDRNNRKGNYVYLATEHNDMTTAILQAWDAVKRELI